ncbi:MAG: RagB/SusD family nutrient uptake outer membrane protein [Haliscomenobacter sp.]|uniref:RagB/SusD family nutrient uptake outer membrane protein n=1 Tax=Haliscomenobacter sp. TaxID=2717303 RepID=UPI0029A03405|nr:RagB/SusD family nutrient uptake outer membrane protein [Haliscomenobacter sp.]MDX2069102.1 RagB/SusD family nutrient uptake outer membrane protein [Haliscomenobacter sp.]
MKANKIFLLVLTLGLSLNACQDQLELKPAQSIADTQASANESNVKAVLIGAYDAMAEGDLFGGNTLRNAELQAGDDEILWVGTFFDPREIFNKTMQTANRDATELWLDGYNAINIANNVLAFLPVVAEKDRKTVEGEAEFIRALVYFELVRFFGKPYVAGQTNSQLGVPLITEPTRGIDEKSQVARSTVEQVYAAVIADLIKAEANLPQTNSWRASSLAATALLARVYLQQGDYAKARDAANKVISSGKFALLADYADNFNRDANSSEDIFAVQVTDQDGINNMNTFFSIPDFGARDGDIEILDGHLNLYPTGDVRKDLFFDGAGAMRTGKWNNQFGNIGLIRLAEMYLIRAEGNARLNASVGATPLADYNTIRKRAGLAEATAVTIDQILLERRLELAHEGFRIHDLKRTKQAVGKFNYDADKLVFPIPFREIEVNKALEQNPGY